MSKLMGIVIPCGVFIGLTAGMVAVVGLSTGSSTALAPSSPTSLALASTSQPKVQQVKTVRIFNLEVPSVPFTFLPTGLANAQGLVTWQQNINSDQSTSDRLLIKVMGLPANQVYTIFLTAKPTPTFGGASYIADIKTDKNGNGTATYQGEVKNAFILEWGGAMKPNIYERVELDYVVIWAADPAVTDNIFNQQGDNRRPRTPFDADSEAGIVVLTTSSNPKSPLAN